MHESEKLIGKWQSALADKSNVPKACVDILSELHKSPKSHHSYLSLKLLQIVAEFCDNIFKNDCLEAIELIAEIRLAVVDAKNEKYFATFMQRILKIIWTSLKEVSVS